MYLWYIQWKHRSEGHQNTSVFGIIRELEMAVSVNNTYELFRIRVINTSGHKAQLVTNILSPPEAFLSLLYNIMLLFECIAKAFVHLEM